MQSDLARRVFRAVMPQSIMRRNMLCASDCVGVGVSGGADSVALLRLLEELQSDLGIRLVALHFNHQLRGAESDADEEFVAALAAQRNIPFFAGREDVSAVAREHGWNLEDAGRRLRYAYFGSVLAAGHISRVAVAHTVDDQAETEGAPADDYDARLRAYRNIVARRGQASFRAALLEAYKGKCAITGCEAAAALALHNGDAATVNQQSLSDFVYSFGQFMDHDMDLTLERPGQLRH